MTNKITVGIETMNSSYLGIKGLNVMMTQELLEHTLLMLSLMHYRRFQTRDLHSVLFRTVLSTQSTTLTTLLRIPHQLSLVSVIQIWLKRWLTTARTTFLLRLDSLCLHRLISLIRVFSHSYSNHPQLHVVQYKRARKELFYISL